MSKMQKIAVIIIAVIAAIILIVSCSILSSGMLDAPESVEPDNTNVLVEDNETFDMGNGSSSVTVEEIEDTQTTELDSIIVQDTDNDEEPQYSDTSGNPNDFSDELILDNVNQEKAREVAEGFARGFLTYTTDSLKTNSYKPSWVNYVMVTDDTGNLLKTRMNDAWTRNVSTYNGVYSAVTDVKVDNIYVSHTTHDNIIAVSLTCIIDENQGEPGDGVDWEIVNTNEVHYAIYLNSDLQVIDVRRQDAKTINSNIFNMESNSPVQ